MKLSEVGPALRLIRKKSPYLLKEVAARSGVTIAMIGHIERGARTGSWEVLERLAAALDHDLGVVIQAQDRTAENVTVTREESALLAANRSLSGKHQQALMMLAEVLPSMTPGQEDLILGQLELLSQRLRRAANQ
jgi:transcriptional regulator with XRE-family HTH domain